MGDTEQQYCILHLKGSVLTYFSSSQSLTNSIGKKYLVGHGSHFEGKWDCIVEGFDHKAAQRHQFLTLWTVTPLMTSKNVTPFWHFPLFCHQNGCFLR